MNSNYIKLGGLILGVVATFLTGQQFPTSNAANRKVTKDAEKAKNSEAKKAANE